MRKIKITKQQEKHLASLKKEFVEKLDKKYRQGAKEHGGNIWDNNNLLDEAIAETVDLYAYLQTLKKIVSEIRNYD